MKKQCKLDFTGFVDIAEYGICLDGKNMSSIVHEAMTEQADEYISGLMRVTVAIEPVEGAGLRVKAE